MLKCPLLAYGGVATIEKPWGRRGGLSFMELWSNILWFSERYAHAAKIHESSWYTCTRKTSIDSRNICRKGIHIRNHEYVKCVHKWHQKHSNPEQTAVWTSIPLMDVSTTSGSNSNPRCAWETRFGLSQAAWILTWIPWGDHVKFGKYLLDDWMTLHAIYQHRRLCTSLLLFLFLMWWIDVSCGESFGDWA